MLLLELFRKRLGCIYMAQFHCVFRGLNQAPHHQILKNNPYLNPLEQLECGNVVSEIWLFQSSYTNYTIDILDFGCPGGGKTLGMEYLGKGTGGTEFAHSAQFWIITV